MNLMGLNWLKQKYFFKRKRTVSDYNNRKCPKGVKISYNFNLTEMFVRSWQKEI